MIRRPEHATAAVGSSNGFLPDASSFSRLKSGNLQFGPKLRLLSHGGGRALDCTYPSRLMQSEWETCRVPGEIPVVHVIDAQQ